MIARLAVSQTTAQSACSILSIPLGVYPAAFLHCRASKRSCAVLNRTQIRAMSEQQKKKPWYMELPDPKSTVEGVEAEEVLGWIENADKVVGRDYLLVDVRKDDHEGGTIAGSLNLPGQTFMDMRPTLLNLVAGVGVKSVVFYCGSCLGRGPRVAGWFKDYVEEQNNKNIDVLYLKGGIKGWVKDGYTAKMDSFDPKAWKL